MNAERLIRLRQFYKKNSTLTGQLTGENRHCYASVATPDSGIRHDDYDYAEVNVMLTKAMKTFIKTACCYPERVTEALRSSVMTDFKLSEKVRNFSNILNSKKVISPRCTSNPSDFFQVHVILMVMEARLQAELLYFLRALIRMNNRSSVSFQ